MGYIKQIKTTPKVQIPSSTVLNLGQTPSKFVPSASTTLVPRGERSILTTGSFGKRAIATSFTISHDGDSLPRQLIYQRTALRKKNPYLEFFWSVFFCIRTEYGETRSISPHSVRMRENTDQNNSEYVHFSRSAAVRSLPRFEFPNTRESLKIIDEFIVLYVNICSC